MLIVYGVYRWKPKRLGFRNDYCLKCEGPRRAIHVRTFNVGHIYWIPLIPAGFWKRWICTVCGRDPHVNPKTRRPFKWLGFFILLLMTAAFWIMPLDPRDPSGVILSWIFRFAAPIGAVLTIWHLLRTNREPSLESRLAAIPPASETSCPFCGTQLLMLASGCSCPACGSVRM
jgi:hypothetical protein